MHFGLTCVDTHPHTHTHTPRIDTTAGTMPREQQAGAQDDDAGKCAAPQLDQQELRSRKRMLIQAILTEYTNKRKLVTQGVVLKMAIQACIKTVQDQQKTIENLDTVQAISTLLDKCNRADLRASMEPLIEG